MPLRESAGHFVTKRVNLSDRQSMDPHVVSLSVGAASKAVLERDFLRSHSR